MKPLVIFLVITAILFTARHFKLLATLPVAGTLCILVTVFAVLLIIRILSK